MAGPFIIRHNITVKLYEVKQSVYNINSLNHAVYSYFTSDTYKQHEAVLLYYLHYGVFEKKDTIIKCTRICEILYAKEEKLWGGVVFLLEMIVMNFSRSQAVEVIKTTCYTICYQSQFRLKDIILFKYMTYLVLDILH